MLLVYSSAACNVNLIFILTLSLLLMEKVKNSQKIPFFLEILGSS